jgi:TetR/AcrR family transcriptional regulator, transcriptional repressor for nem operon
MKNTKEYIIKIALKLFLQKNFKEVTMKEIVDKTGLSKGACYHYFESKEKLFEEAIDYILHTQLYFNFDKYSKSSCYDFYHACANNSLPLIELHSEDEQEENDLDFAPNFYFLIFDAMHLIQGFKKKMVDHQEKEMAAWSQVIKNAKDSGEIKSSMSEKQIAMIFISTGDGVALNLIMGNKYENVKNELLSLWDCFYNSLKV